MKRKILSFLTAFAMVFGIIAAPFTSAKAATNTAETTDSVTVHKILMNKTDFDAFDAGTKGKNESEYNGNSITDLGGFFGESAKEIDGVFFKLQKPAQGQTDPDVNNDDHWVDVEGSDLDSSVTDPILFGETGENGLKLDTKGLKGQFRIVEDLEKSTYKGEDGNELAAQKAVPVLITLPLVNNNGVVADAHVYPKNTQDKPQIDKNFAKSNNATEVKKDNKDLSTASDSTNKVVAPNAGADYENYQKEKARVTASIGKEIPFEVKSKIPQDAKYKKLVWNDTMTNGLTYNQDLSITSEQLTGEKALTENTDYTILQDDRGFELKLTETGLKKVEEAAKTSAVEFTLTYSAKVNSDAVEDIPEKNDIKLDYGNKPGKDSTPKEVKPSEGKIKVTKTWADGENTQAPENVKVVYTLQKQNESNGWDNVESVTKTGSDFNHTFEGLDDNATYRVVERVSGYDPKYTTDQNGQLSIKNTKDNDNPTPLNPTEPEVVNGGKKFVKTSEDEKERLAGAEFYVINEQGQYLKATSNNQQAVTEAKNKLEEAVKAYNNRTEEQDEAQLKAAIDTAQEAYNKVFIENAQNYEFTNNENEAVVLTSDGQGRFEIKGLAYGNYKLKEKTAPEGYAKLSGNIDFEVKKGSYVGADTELQYNANDANAGYGKQIVNKKVTIPQTGGIGSLIFVAGGLVIMAGAFIAYKRSEARA